MNFFSKEISEEMSMTWCSLGTVQVQATISASNAFLTQRESYISESETQRVKVT